MAETTSREGGNYATEIPSRYLPPVEYRDLPEPKKLSQIIGASVIILATAIGSGEFVLWPYITSQIGFVFMWGAMVGFLMQYFINMEIERYTLATGETAITGFTRLWKPWWWLFIIFVLLQNFWPGWATGAATTLSYIFAFEGGNAIVYVTVAMLISIGIALTTSPVVYTFVEKLQAFMVAGIMLFATVAIFVATSASDWGDLVTNSVTNAGLPFGREGLGAALLLGALAFAGAGGANNLVQSNYIRDKGLGMGQRIPNLVSPFTGEEQAAPETGFFFRRDEENMRRWRGWWKVANQEQFLVFYVIGVLSLIIFSVLTYATVPVGEVEARDLEFIRVEGQTLQQNIAPWFGIAFWIAGTFALFSTNLGIIDYTCRLIADQIQMNATRHSQFWTESRLYATFVWTMVVVGSSILLLGLDQPLILLIIASSIAGLQMFIYSGLLIWLNRGVLPREIGLRSYRLVVMVAVFLFFGFFSVMVLWDQITTNLLGG